MEKEFIKGAFLNAPRENAPTFVKGSISIKVEQFVEYLKEKQNQSGYVNIDLLETREGKLYMKLNDYQTKKFDSETQRIASENSDFISIDDIPL